MKKTIMTGLAALLATPAVASTYAYHPNSPIYLGGGYDPFRPTDGLQQCLEWDRVVPIDSTDGTRAIDTRALVQTVKSRRDFYDLIDFSTQIQGGYGIFSGDASVNLIDEYAFHEDSLTWIVLFRTDYGRFRLQNERLKTQFSTIDIENLTRRCGTEVVTTQRLGVMVYAVLTVRNVNESKRRDFEAKLNVSLKGALWSSEMDSEYKRILRSALAATDFSVRIRAIGGGGVVDLSSLIGGGSGADTFVQYEQIPSVIRRYVENLNVQSAAPIQYVTNPLADYRDDIPRSPNAFQSVQFEKLYTSYERFASVVNRLEDLLYGSAATDYDLSHDEISALEHNLTSHKKARDALYSAGLACFQRSSSCLEPETRERLIVVWPRPRKYTEACERNRRFAYNTGLVPEEYYQMAKSRDLVFLLDNGEVVGLERCELFSF